MRTDQKSRISVVDDEASILDVMRRHLEESGYEVATYSNAQDAVSSLTSWNPHLVITDLRLGTSNGLDVLKAVKAHDPDTNVIMMTAYASVESAVNAIRFGAVDYVIKPFKFEALDCAIQRALSETRLVPGVAAIDKDFPDRYKVKNLIGISEEMKKVYDLIEKSARTASSVLITGESGTGKELVARAIHYNSHRKNQPFVGINCAALPESLLESELFGHEKGSFTGAIATKMGLLELADKGTFFLDEVGEITPPIQVKLLRALQEKVIKRVGGLKDIPIDVRIIAATNRNLTGAVQDTAFRHELYYRLNVIPIFVPPLRQRKDDIPKLAQHFVQTFVKKMENKTAVRITDSAIALLQGYDWPGNVRELENVIERILALSENGTIDRAQIEEALPLHTSQTSPALAHLTSGVEGLPLREALDGLERKLIGEALAENKGNKLKTAKQLGLTRQSLQYKIKKFGLS